VTTSDVSFGKVHVCWNIQRKICTSDSQLSQLSFPFHENLSLMNKHTVIWIQWTYDW